MVTLDQLQVFAQVVDSGSFTAAARELHRVQSAVSYAIANLEDQLDVELFDRSGRRPKLTEAGVSLLADVRSVNSRVDGLMARARWLSEHPEPRVALAVDVMFPMDALLTHLADFQERFPFVELEVYTESLGGVAQLVLDGVCDLGVGMSFGEIPAELVHRDALPIPSAMVANPDHPLSSLERGFPAAALEDHVQVVLTDRSGITAGQQRGVYGTRIWRVADLHTKRALLVGGFGWGSMPLHMVEDDIAAGRLVQISPEDWPGIRNIQLQLMTRRRHPPGLAGSWLLERVAPPVP